MRGPRRSATTLTATVVLVMATSAAESIVPQETTRPPDSAATVAAFTERLPTRAPPNRATRRLEAANKGFKGWLEASTEVHEDGKFTFKVTGEGGSGLIRGRVLKAALEAEQKAAVGDPAAMAFTPQNYVITDLGPTPEGLVKIGLKARREDRMLLNGFALVTPGDARLVRVEGRVAKNPSWWTTRVDIVRRYETVGVHTMLVDLESTAQIRLFGQSHFRMQIRYESLTVLPVGPPVASPASSNPGGSRPRQ